MSPHSHYMIGVIVRYKRMVFGLLACVLLLAGCGIEVTNVRMVDGTVGTVGETGSLIRFLLSEDNNTLYTCPLSEVDACSLIKPGKSVSMTVGTYHNSRETSGPVDNYVRKLAITRQ